MDGTAKLLTYQDNHGNFQTWVYPWYPDYWYSWVEKEPNKTDQAFKVVKVLLEQKIIKINSVKQFMRLMDKLIEIL